MIDLMLDVGTLKNTQHNNIVSLVGRLVASTLSTFLQKKHQSDETIELKSAMVVDGNGNSIEVILPNNVSFVVDAPIAIISGRVKSQSNCTTINASSTKVCMVMAGMGEIPAELQELAQKAMCLDMSGVSLKKDAPTTQLASIIEQLGSDDTDGPRDR